MNSKSFSRSHICTCLAMAGLLSACGGGHSPTAPLPEAETATIAPAAPRAGITPFIQMLDFKGTGMADVSTLHFVIAAKPGTTAAPVDVTYTVAALDKRGYLTADTLTLPVFGLYANYANQVSVAMTFKDGSTKHWPVTMTSASYTDSTSIYSAPNILQPRAAGSALGYSYMALKSGLGAPVIIDTDGQIRWVGTGIANSFSTAFYQNAFVMGQAKSTGMLIQELDGSTHTLSLQSSTYTNFHHNIDHGKTGLLAELDALIGGVTTLESNVAEIDTSGAVLKEWNLGTLISDYMRSQGDDPSLFVRPGVADWFHNNATTYDSRDDSVIVSSRENFVIKLDYATGRIIWIFGDPTKYWYTFPSLRAKALKLSDGGLYPIGQHGISITSDGLLMLFNDGLGSQNQPAGAPAGASRTYSAVSAYSIDPQAMSAQEVWTFDHGKTIFSDICSSAYEGPSKSLLVTYSVADQRSHMRLMGLDANRNIVFDFEYPTISCNTSWNSLPMPLDSLKIN